MFRSLLGASSIANKARLLAVSAPHAAYTWISMVPSVSLGLHLDPSEFRVAITVIRHNQLVFSDACCRAHFPVRIEITPDYNHSRPADVLVEGWERGKPAVFDITVILHSAQPF